MRVKAIDTFEHITEFGSSADHTLTLQKWHEMGVPLSTPAKQTSSSNFAVEPPASGKSVFEDSIDTIAPADGKAPGKDVVRWKFSGPWLAGLTEGEFNTYVLKEVRRRKDDFRKFLRTACAIETTQAQHHLATDQGEDIPPAVHASDITNDQLTEYIKGLRKDRTKLNKHIRSFLDLPPSPSINVSEDFISGTMPSIFSDMPREVQSTSDSPYADSGPPKTHPSAGLGYSRTNSYLFNHPLYGPQKNKPPVQARVIMPKGAATGNFAPILGVGGIAVNVPAGEASFDVRPGAKGAHNRAPPMSGLFNVDPDAVGGSKAWVHPKHARIDPKGRIVLNVVTADPEAVAVKEGKVRDIPNKYDKPAPMKLYGLSSAGAGQYGGGYGVSRRDFSGKAEHRRMVKKDNDALKELAGFVDRQEGKGKVE